MATVDLTPEDLSGLIGLVYDSAFEEVQWKSFLHRMCQMFPGIGAVAWGYEGDYMFPEYARGGEEAIFPKVALMEMRTLTNQTTSEITKVIPSGYVSRTKLHFEEAEWRKSTIYREYLGPAGFCHSLHLKVGHNGDRGAYLAFSIPENKTLEAKIHDPLFDLLKLLSPHVVRACQLARALTMAKRATEIFGGFLDGILIPMLVSDDKGHFLFANAAGRRVLDRSDPLYLSANGTLALNNAIDSRTLLRQLLAVGNDRPVEGLKVDTEDGSPLLLALAPFRPSMSEASKIDRHLLEDQQLCAVFVGHSEDDAINVQLLEDVFDMTPREAEICSNLMQGASAAEIAEASRRSLKTVRNQIQVVYEKVGVSSNVALMDALSVFRSVGGMFSNDLSVEKLSDA